MSPGAANRGGSESGTKFLIRQVISVLTGDHTIDRIVKCPSEPFLLPRNDGGRHGLGWVRGDGNGGKVPFPLLFTGNKDRTNIADPAGFCLSQRPAWTVAGGAGLLPMDA